MPELSDDHRVTLRALALMSAQYLSNKEGILDHQWMTAGEHAFSVLSGYGLIETDSGRGAAWTEAGHQLLNSN